MYSVYLWKQIKKPKEKKAKTPKGKKVDAPKNGTPSKSNGTSVIDVSGSNGDHFLDHCMGTAIKCLRLNLAYLEDEKRKWAKIQRTDSADKKVPITFRNIRKICGQTRRQLESLDMALIKSFAKEYPGEVGAVMIGSSRPTPRPLSIAKTKRPMNNIMAPKRVGKMSATSLKFDGEGKFV